MLNIRDLKTKFLKREETNKKIYKNILQKCHNRILYASNQLDETHILYEIPSIIFGTPLFNRESCSFFIIQSLIKNGFKVKYLGNNFLFISWQHIHEKNEYPKITKRPPKLIEGSKRNFRSVDDVPQSDNFFL